MSRIVNKLTSNIELQSYASLTPVNKLVVPARMSMNPGREYSSRQMSEDQLLNPGLLQP